MERSYKGIRIQNKLLSRQKAYKDLILQVSSLCQAALEGKYVPDEEGSLIDESEKDPELIAFGKAITTVLEGYTAYQQEASTNRREMLELHTQLAQISYEVRPVLNGDLRVRSTIAEGELGLISSFCNTLIEDTAQMVQWAHHMAEQIILVTHQLMEQSLHIAHSIETLTEYQKGILHDTETLINLTQQLEHTIGTNLNIFTGSLAHLEYNVDPLSSLLEATKQTSNSLSAETPEPLGLFGEVPTSEQVLQYLLAQSHHITNFSARITNGQDTYNTLEKAIYQINDAMMQFSGIISTLATLADQWRQAAEHYTVPSLEEVQA